MRKTEGLLRFDLESRLEAEKRDGTRALYHGDQRRLAALYGVNTTVVHRMWHRIHDASLGLRTSIRGYVIRGSA